MVALCRPNVVVDIGPGMGKYGKILGDIERQTGSAIHKVAVEIDKERVIDRFRLGDIYDEIINEDAASIVKTYPSLTGDIAIAGDVIEHLTKSEGIDLIEYLQYRFKQIFLVIPTDWVEYSYEDYEHESHISIWRTVDIERFEGGYCVERFTPGGNRFLLCSINGIAVPTDHHFVVRDKASSGQKTLNEENIDFGFLNFALTEEQIGSSNITSSDLAYQALQETILSLRHEIEALKESRSWRVTAPLRFIAEKMRGR
jgi:hypothetical protein